MAGAIKQGGGGRKGGGAPNAEPNVIPFIDIMLVLLIIFMVAAPPPTVDIKVDLPPPNAQNRPNQDDRPTFVSLEDENGELQYFVSGNSVQLDALPIALLNAARLNNPTMRGDDAKLFLEGKIFVDADQETQYFNVINLMNTIDQTGFKKVSLVAEEAQF